MTASAQRFLKFGKRAPIQDSRTLSLGAYITPDLPEPPKSMNWGKLVRSWPMYLNDELGDCTCAAAGHMVEAWTASAGHPTVPMSTSVLAMYRVFNPGVQDNGCAMLDILRYWRTSGLGADKISAFAGLEPRNIMQVREAVWLFGDCYIGIVLPQFAANGPDLLKVPWVMKSYGTLGDGAPDPYAGHCVNAVAYDARYLYVVTWGAIKAMSWGFYQAYCDEAYAVLSPDFLAGGKTPIGFDMPRLQADLADIHKVSEARTSIALVK